MPLTKNFDSSCERLNDLIDKERKKVLAALNQSKSPYKDLISIIRQFDLFYISVQSGGQPDKKQANKILEFYRYGWSDSLAYYLPKVSSLDSPPVFPSNIQAQSWADSVLGVSGKIATAARQLDIAKAGLIDIEQTAQNTFITKFKHIIKEKEHYDRESFEFVKGLALTILKERHEAHLANFEDIRKLLPDIIQNPLGKFIGYKATEEIDNYYAEAGYFHVLKEQGYEEFGEEDIFGGISYKHYLDCVQDTSSGTLLHIDCCHELLNKNPSVNPYDIFTYNWYLDKKIEGYASHFGLPLETASQILSCFILTEENLPFYQNLRGSLPPPFIQTGKNQYARSIYGSLHGAIDFLKRELKRRYEKDYFLAVNKREKRFRDNLYVFFPGERFIRVDKEIILKYDGLHTDIDAVVYDKKTKSLGLFQLKWQDMFYTSTTERYSRISNLFPKATEWIDKMENWINNFTQKDVIKKLTLDKNSVNEIGQVFIFVIARNHVHFTGVEPDGRAAWATMNQIPFSLSRIKTSFDDPIRELHLKLKMDSPEERVKREGYPMLQNYKIELDSFSIE
ncbi:hypothetical protein [Mucilaginibacter sp. L3T2-6]|uniref:hypothetical protein n=1 Tax=Mucilaginibacter sp. L3T2-6 TaxID=3062491 RepID=UPI0026746DC0|nr:hypothetical protein [Mucilaginibacter sp. L3T2-6]MDO3643495.1 hypothetical protein [Mucilaginibacter sp. L3T2-6]MDV6215946.1 hypothetical protein [Mucilaginibacter sp. L3T2-6]